MNERVFFDTNVLIYADDRDSPSKSALAQDLLKQAFSAATGVISTQVLQEFFVIATRKLGVAADVARRKVELFGNLDVIVVRPSVILAAIDLHRLHRFSFWDALVVKCASLAGCGRLLSEDLQHGQIIEGVRIQNPFR